jgi:hypothetical protein
MAKVLLAIPTSGGIHERVSMFATYLSKEQNVDYVNAKGRPCDFVRNNFIRLFLRGDWSHILFLDSDTEGPLDCLQKLLALDVPLATGCYPVLMPDGLRWALANKGSDQHYRLLECLPSLDKPFEVDAGGAGCLLIRRDVFDVVKWPWFKWGETEDGGQTGEDIHFFQKCNDAGLRVMAEPTVIVNHYKTINLTSLMLMKKNQPSIKE